MLGADDPSGRRGSVGHVLTAAALVPPTALLVPGAAGRAEVLSEERRAALDAALRALDAAPDAVVVVSGTGNGATGPARPSLAAAGVDDRHLAWPSHAVPGDGPPVTAADIGTSVGLLLLAAAGWAGQVETLGVGDMDASTCRAAGASIATGRRVVLLLVGGLSGRHGPDGPLPTDTRAAALDEDVARDLLDLGTKARARLAAIPAGLAADLAVSAWGPWQVLLGAAPASDPRSALHGVGAPFGATYATLSWRW